jgi:glycosyltransferase involved in cell wall biosynthesis
MMISVIILTKNEELDLPSCLKALQWCDDIHVLDSGSTDKTIDISRQFNANISFNKFESFGQQRNYALDHVNFKHEWVLFLDADEIVTDKFRSAVFKEIKEASDDVAGFYCCWKMVLENTWLKHADNFPKWQFRLMRKGRARFTDFGHGQKEHDVKGGVLYLKEPYLHYAFSKGWFVWFDRHNRYSTQEAAERLSNCPPFENIFTGNSSVRNPALKSWLSRLPGWPVLRFVQAYILNLGFLEGVPGLIYCTNMGFYEFLIQIKMREIRKRKGSTHRNLSV